MKDFSKDTDLIGMMQKNVLELETQSLIGHEQVKKTSVEV